MRTILSHLCSCLENGTSAVLATIVGNAGSAPRSHGTRMLCCHDGRLLGTIGGGELEGKCIARAREMLAGEAGHDLLRFALNAGEAAAAGMICGGNVRVLLQRLEPEAGMIALFRGLRQAFEAGEAPVLLTLMPEQGAPRLQVLIPGDAAAPGLAPELRDEVIRRVGKSDMPFTVASAAGTVYAEPLVHPLRLHLAGAGHVALATAQLAGFLGYEVVVIDDRPEFASRDRFPQASEVRVCPFDNCLGRLTACDYVVIVTRGHLYDQEVLVQALRSGAGYVGMIGSRRKREAICAALRQQGFTETDLARVHSPIGLPIGGESPEEIALSIMAEIQQHRYRQSP
jgi:xanthine dehydrogenase accessory factor